MSSGELPSRRYLWSKYAWKTIREAMRSTPDTIRFVTILTAMIVMPALAGVVAVSVVRCAWF